MIYIAVFIGGLFLTVLFVFPVQRLARALGAIANPGGRSIHNTPTPLIGGLAIYLSCMVLGVAFLLWNSMLSQSLLSSSTKLLGLFLGATVLLLVGIVDDIKALRVRYKLMGQITAAIIPAFFGFTIQAIKIPFVGTIPLGQIGSIIFVLWVLGITNAVNLIDGLDGLASTVCFFAAFGNGIIALTLGNVFIAFFSFLLAGCLLGFLFHNFPPAKIFLGDTGSMLIGFLLAVTVIESNMQKRSTTLMILAPLLLLAFSLLDVLLSIVRRFLRGKPIFSSDLGHIHHRLMSRFRNPRRVLVVVGGFSLFTMLVSLGIHFARYSNSPLIFWTILAFAVVALGLFVRLLGYFRSDRLRYVLEKREGIKFFFALLSYLGGSLLKRQSQREVLAELDWVCQALKPNHLTLRDANKEILFSYSCTTEAQKKQVYSDEYRTPSMSFEWVDSTDADDPQMCDVRLLWRRLFAMFAEHLERVNAEQSPNPDLRMLSAHSEPREEGPTEPGAGATIQVLDT